MGDATARRQDCESKCKFIRVGNLTSSNQRCFDPEYIIIETRLGIVKNLVVTSIQIPPEKLIEIYSEIIVSNE